MISNFIYATLQQNAAAVVQKCAFPHTYDVLSAFSLYFRFVIY